ncbi:phosphotransferase [Chlorobium sp. N1]|uniref:phosphotransferase n=1 Tax=Chlorobium sp. N1 TaxID=2491138 RepID=UPI00103C7A2A|nr:phosphotransferase [Chlorobium sp. N1]TCD48445.1 phosphotransferase [Chlorobium sp. N1]
MDWLFCDFHIHTTWSDGALSVAEVVELYGRTGFDVIAITDHVLDSGSLAAGEPHWSVPEERFGEYLHELWEAARLAWERWHMLLLPGMELTNNTSRYHILALDVKEFISPDLEVEPMLCEIRRQGAVSVACHPFVRNHSGESPSEHLWQHHERYASMFDAWEVANRDDLFNVVGLKKFNYIANSDFHEEKHLRSWKTLLRCDGNAEAVKQAIRTNAAVSLFLYRGGPLRGDGFPSPGMP